MNACPESSPNLEVLLEIPLSISVELASCTKSIADVLGLAVGSVLLFNECATDPVGLYVSGRLAARGEITATQEHLNIKVTEVISQPK